MRRPCPARRASRRTQCDDKVLSETKSWSGRESVVLGCYGGARRELCVADPPAPRNRRERKTHPAPVEDAVRRRLPRSGPVLEGRPRKCWRAKTCARRARLRTSRRLLARRSCYPRPHPTTSHPEGAAERREPWFGEGRRIWAALWNKFVP